MRKVQSKFKKEDEGLPPLQKGRNNYKSEPKYGYRVAVTEATYDDHPGEQSQENLQALVNDLIIKPEKS